MPEDQQEQIKNQKLDDVTKQYDHNYGNFILSCTHKKKVQLKFLYSQNNLFWIMLYYVAHHTSGLQSTDPHASVFNSREKAYLSNRKFKKKCDMMSISLIYEHQQQEHIALIKDLETVPEQFHKLPFHSWVHNNTPVNALTEKAHEMIWHQQLIHLCQVLFRRLTNMLIVFQIFPDLILMMLLSVLLVQKLTFVRIVR